jgi:putative endonuclease
MAKSPERSQSTQALGRQAERAAERELRRRGYRIVARNVRAAGGEIDLVALQGETVCFVEVRSRSAGDPASALESVGVDKRRQLTKLARAFLLQRRLEGVPARFDVVAVVPDSTGGYHVSVIADAFPAQGRYA